MRTELLSKQIKDNKFNCKKRLMFEFKFELATGVLNVLASLIPLGKFTVNLNFLS